MNLDTKRVIFINLRNRSSNVKGYVDLNEYIGGLGLGLKLLQNQIDEDPVILSIGPLSGMFPYATKTAVVLEDSGAIEDLYIGGTLASRIRFAGLDSIVILGRATKEVIIDITNRDVAFREADKTDIRSLGLPGKRSILFRDKKEVKLDGYFFTPEDFLHEKFVRHNLSGIVVTGTEAFKPPNFEKYQDIYFQILERTHELSVKKGLYPSCTVCPMGCEQSSSGEIGGNVLIHSLVTCGFAEKIYADPGIIFSCLNVLGYHYTHEDIENLPNIIEKILKRPIY